MNHLTRRDFLAASLIAAAGASAAAAGLQPATGGDKKDQPKTDKPAVAKADKPLKILFLGGTIFLGPATVDYLLARGHTVTLFNRGKSNPQLYPDLEKLRGDRKGDFKSLEAEIAKGRRWDAVIDTSAYVPKQMRELTQVLKSATDYYAMVASVNVYKDETAPNQDETGPTWDTWPDDEAVTGQNYGPMKRGCEKVLEELMPGRWSSLRPALIIGPRDPSDRFSYWPLRVRRGGEVLAPVGPDEPCTIVDARDLGVLLCNMCERKFVGPVNGLGSPGLTMGYVLAECMAAAKAAGAPAATLNWAPLSFLQANNVQAWSDMPAWVPSADPNYTGMNSRVGMKQIELGGRFRPIGQTAKDIYTWWDALPEARRAKVRSGLSAERETELLAKLTKKG